MWRDDVPVGRSSPQILHRIRWGRCRAVFTGRSGGYSRDEFAGANLAEHVGDDPLTVAMNRQIIAEELGISVDWAVVNQVHGAEVRVARPGNCGNGDAILLSEPGLPGAIFTADCLPVLITEGSNAALVHAGWRGLEAGVLQVASEKIANSARVAFVGPAIGRCCYRVGKDMAERFASNYGADVVGADSTLDLAGVARKILREECGVENIVELGPCTHSEELFSYRNDGSVTGRQALLAWLE